MPPELRKRKAPAPPPVAEPKAKRGAKRPAKETVAKEVKVAKEVEKVDKDDKDDKDEKKDEKDEFPATGDVLDLSRFADEIQLDDGSTTSLKALVEASKAGVAIFTYPKASTPGCTRQACAFRDDHAALTAGGLSIFGLSGDAPKANAAFRTKQKLPFPLLCDPGFVLIGAMGLKKTPRGTVRGVFAVDRQGKLLLRAAGGPEKTLSLVQDVVADL